MLNGAELVCAGPVELSVQAGLLEPPPELSGRVDAIWSREREARPWLVDGTILSVVGIADGRVVAKRCPYRLFVARERDDELRRLLGVRAVGVSGVVLVDHDHVVLGRRAETVTEYPGAWELVPSGGIDAIDEPPGAVAPVDALLTELEEETGLSRDSVGEVKPVGLVHDLAQDGYDICFMLRVAGEVKPRAEYGEVEVVSLAEARERLANGPAVPTSRVLLEAV